VTRATPVPSRFIVYRSYGPSRLELKRIFSASGDQNGVDAGVVSWVRPLPSGSADQITPARSKVNFEPSGAHLGQPE